MSRCSSDIYILETSGCLLLLTADPLVVRHARKAASAAGLDVTLPTDAMRDDRTAIVIDLEQPGAIDEVAVIRAANPDAFLAGHLSHPDQERWVAAERAGCDLVANRGAIGRLLRERLRSGSGARRRFPLLDDDDVAGRLGLVRAIDDTPFGPVGVYHVNGRVTAIGDICPHAGAQLSAGEVEGCVLTCPRHGSQFDVQTGDRLRGPSDHEVKSYEVLREAGRVQLVWSD
jgi:nitrite reductase/ring-hydroxylating ferredoxin subunit